MKLIFLIFFAVFPSITTSHNDGSINFLVRSFSNESFGRYCGTTVKFNFLESMDFGEFSWQKIYIPTGMSNSCDIDEIRRFLPREQISDGLLVINQNQCKITKLAWAIENEFQRKLGLLILLKDSEFQYSFYFDLNTMPISIPVLTMDQKDFSKLDKKVQSNFSEIQISIAEPLIRTRKFRPTVLLMFVLVFLIFIAGNSWGADEFRRIIQLNQKKKQTEQIENLENNLTENLSNETSQDVEQNSSKKKTKNKKEKDLAVLSMPCRAVIFTLGFAIAWLLLIYYFPKVMIYALHLIFCMGALSAIYNCLKRLSDFVPTIGKIQFPSFSLKKPVQRQFGPWKVVSFLSFVVGLSLVIVWYVYRQAEWAWVLQDILGASICIYLVSIYRLGNMRIITLILLGFFIYDIFFVFVTPHIPLFQSSKPAQSKITTSSQIMPLLRSSKESVGEETKSESHRTPSVMEQVALGLGTDGEVVPLLFVLPVYIPESEFDPCVQIRKSMLGFGDVILPGILLTFCRIFDIAASNPWPIYYIQSLISYFIGLSLTHLALYLMNTGQPALLYLVPCILLSTIMTGICRGDLKELYTGHRIKSLLEEQKHDQMVSLLTNVQQSNIENSNQIANNVIAHDQQLNNDENAHEKS